VLPGISPGFFFQRCLPIWNKRLNELIKDKARALVLLDGQSNAGGAPVRGDGGLCRALCERRSAAFRALRQRIAGVELAIRNISPFVTGIGQPHPLENGFAFLKPYGTPFLSASGIKGAVRAACKAVWDEARPKEARELLRHYFGSEDKDPRVEQERGALVFLDMWPEVEDWQDAFRLDVVNPHYGPYYSDKQADVPADWHSPVPSYFLTLRADLRWRLRVLYAPADPRKQRRSWGEDVAAGVTRALTREGFGGKKAWGYGLFVIEGAEPFEQPWCGLVQGASSGPEEGNGEPAVPPATPAATAPGRSPRADAAERRIRGMRVRDVGSLPAIIAEIKTCPEAEQASLFELLRRRVEELVPKGKGREALLRNNPELGWPRGQRATPMDGEPSAT